MKNRDWVLLMFALSVGCSDSTPDVACADCEIQLSHVVSLGTVDGPGALASLPVAVARDSRGRFYVTTPEQGLEPPFVYDSTGRFMTRLGRKGRGPGEYLDPTAILVSPGDTTHILDRGTGRITVLSPSYVVARTVLVLASSYDFVLVTDGQYVINTSGADRPLQLFGREGNELRSFGDVSESRTQDYSWRNGRALAMSRDSGFWSAQRYFAPVVERWDLNGEKRQSLSISLDWFVTYDSLWNASPDLPPMSVITGLWEDNPGCLWILGQTGDSNWRDGLGDPRRVEGQLSYPIVDRERVYDIVVEVVRGSTGQRVAQRRLDRGYLATIVEPGLIATRRESQDGWWLVDVWKVDLDMTGPETVCNAS